MRIDPKYFNIFLGIVAVIAAVLILLYMLNNRKNEKIAFEDRMFAQDSLQTTFWPSVTTADSIRISDLSNRFVVLDFWSNWSDATLQSHQELEELSLEYSDTLLVIAAAVGMEKSEITSYIDNHQFPFYFVAGTQQFSAFNVPGLPAQLVYKPGGKLQSVFLGYPDNSQYDSLRASIINGRSK